MLGKFYAKPFGSIGLSAASQVSDSTGVEKVMKACVSPWKEKGAKG